MIIVKINKGDSIEKAIKTFKRKYDKTKVVKELRKKQAFIKPSVIKRDKKLKAIYIQKLKNSENN